MAEKEGEKEVKDLPKPFKIVKQLLKVERPEKE